MSIRWISKALKLPPFFPKKGSFFACSWSHTCDRAEVHIWMSSLVEAIHYCRKWLFYYVLYCHSCGLKVVLGKTLKLHLKVINHCIFRNLKAFLYREKHRMYFSKSLILSRHYNKCKQWWIVENLCVQYGTAIGVQYMELEHSDLLCNALLILPNWSSGAHFYYIPSSINVW